MKPNPFVLAVVAAVSLSAILIGTLFYVGAFNQATSWPSCQTPCNLNISIQSTLQPTIPDTGEQYQLTAILSPTCQLGSPCPAWVSMPVNGGVGGYYVSWNFGDGTTGVGNPVTHTYPGFIPSAKGCYTATVTVSGTGAAPQHGTASINLNGFGGSC